MSAYAIKHKQERQEALREYLSERGKLAYIFDNIEKMENLDVECGGGGDDENTMRDLQLRHFELKRIKEANDQRIKLLNKYLPDLKATEITGDGGGALSITVMEYKPTE